MSLPSLSAPHGRSPGALSFLVAVVAAGASGCADDALVPLAGAEPPAGQQAPAPAEVERCAPAAGVGGALLTLDHDSPFTFGIAQSPRRVVSSDAEHWVLWDRASGRRIARGSLARWAPPDLVDDVLLTPTPAALELRSAEDGSLVTSIALAGHPVVAKDATLSPDARHVLAIGPREVRVWRRDGALRVARTAPGLLINRIYLGVEHARLAVPSGRVETVSLADGVVRVADGTFQGNVLRWFRDGSHFLTSVGDPADGKATVHVYDQEARLVQVLPWPQRHRTPGPPFAGGDGVHVWVATERLLSEVEEGAPGDTVAVYALGTPDPVLTFEGAPIATVGRTTLFPFAKRTTPREPLLLDLRGAAPSTRVLRLPYAPSNLVTDPQGRAAFHNDGVVYTGSIESGSLPPRPLNCGPLRSVAGARDKLAVATSDRTTRIYDVSTGAPRLAGKIEDFQVESLALSEDGRRLFLHGERSSRDFGSTIRELELTASGEPRGPTPFSLTTAAAPVRLETSTDGAVLALTTCAFRSGGSTDCSGDLYREGRHVQSLPGSSRTSPLLSPSGARIAVSQDIESSLPEARTILYEGPVEKGRLDGVRARAWLDDERLLADLTPGDASAIIDLEGTRLATLRLPRGVPTRRAGASRFQVGTSLFRSSDGALLWDLQRDAMLQTTSALARFATVAGDWFVFAQPGVLRAVQIAIDATAPARGAPDRGGASRRRRPAGSRDSRRAAP